MIQFSAFDSTLHWAGLFGLDFDGGNALLMQSQPLIQPEFAFNYLLPFGTQGILPNSANPSPSQDSDKTPSNAAQSLNEIPTNSHAAASALQPIVLAAVESVTEAQFLLKHFHDAVVPQMSFMPSTSKSPWTIMQLPEAMRTLSDLTYLHTGTLNHVNAANLYALLACSVYHLSVKTLVDLPRSKEHLRNLFESLKERAKRHMQTSLMEELKGAKKAKYKEQLMAILSMLAFTVSWHFG